MPTFDYQNVETGDKVERIYLAGEPVPNEIEVEGQKYKKCVSGFRIGNSRVREWERKVLATDRRPLEPGTDRDIRRAKEARIAKQDVERTELIAETVREVMV